MAKSKKHKYFLAVIAVLILLAAVAVIAWTWLYSGKLTSGKIQVFKVSRLPAALINFHAIPAADLINRYELLAKVPEARATLSDPNLVDTLLQKLIADKELELIARDKNVRVTDANIKELYQQMATELTNGDTKQLDQAVEGYSGLSKGDFQNQVIKISLLKRGLQTWYYSQKQLNASLYKSAQNLLDEAKSNEDFGNLAALHSQDSATAIFAGDSGFVETSKLAPEIAEGIKDAKSNDVKVVAGYDGLHLVKFIGKDNEGANSSERVRLQHIFIKGQGFDQWFQQQTNGFKTTNLSTRLSF